MNKRSSKRPSVNWKWFALLILIVGAVPFLVYANSLSYGLVFNDNQTFKQVFNAPASGLEGIIRVFTQPYVRASFLDDVQHYRTDFGWYHLVNLWAHLGAAVGLAVLVFAVARRVDSHESLTAASALTTQEDNSASAKSASAKGAKKAAKQKAPPAAIASTTPDGQSMAPYVVAGVAGLIYGCHPLATQTATYISARWGALGASNFVFAMAFFALMLFTEGAIRVWCVLVMIAYSLMCLGSSETALVLAPSMVALFYLLKPAKLTAKDWAYDHPIVTALTFVFTVTVPAMLIFGFGPAAAPNSFGMAKLSHAAYYATQFKAFLTYYTRTFFAPFGLSVDPPFAEATGFTDVVAIAGIALFAGFVYLLYRYRTNKLLFLGLWLTVAGFVPHAFIYQPDAISDPAFAVSLAGLSLVAAWALCELWPGPLKSEAIKFGAVVAILTGLSIWHNQDFKNNQALVAATLSSNHRSVLATVLSAQQKLAKGDTEGAVKDADEAISLDPESARGYYVRGMAQLRAREDSEAKNSFEKAQDRAVKQGLPFLAEIKYGLAEAYLNMDNMDKATSVANDAFQLDPRTPRAKYIMGLIGMKRHDWRMAMDYLQQALQDGVADARLPGARVLMGLQQFASAQQLASSLVATDNSPEVQLILGNAALAQNDLKTAEPALGAALKANRRNAEAMALLSILYERKGDKAVAESYHKDAVQLDPQIFQKLLMPVTIKPMVKPVETPAGKPDDKAAAKKTK